MYYEVTDFNNVINGHDVTIRVMLAEDESAKDVAYMCCSTCSLMTEYNFYANDPDVFYMDIIDIECHLHAEGFDVDWTYGELDKLDS